MTKFRVLLWRALDRLNRRRRERQLREEIRSHLDDLVEDHIAQGLSPEAAEAAARRDFGGVESIKDTYRDQRGLPVIDALWFDLRHAVRAIRSKPASSCIAIAVLALGIAAGNTVFTIANAICLRGLPIPRPERVLNVDTRDAQSRVADLSFFEFQEVNRLPALFDGVGAYTPSTSAVVSADAQVPERLSVTHISAGAFRVLGESPMRGREFVEADDQPGAPLTAILGAAVWRGRYGADDAVVGQVIEIDGEPAVVVGVMADGFRFPANAQMWLPLQKRRGLVDAGRDARTLDVYGRLRDGATTETAQAALANLAGDLSTRFPDTNDGRRFESAPINDVFNGDIRDRVWRAFLAAGFIVFLVSCANAANLLLIRAVLRTREIAVRASIGATRARIVRQLLTECGVLAGLAGGLGVLLSFAAVRLLASSVPQSAPLPYWIDYAIDGHVLSVLIGLCVATIFLCGLAPALKVSRLRITSALWENGPNVGSSRRTSRWTSTLLAAEFALSFVLLAGVSASLNWFGNEVRRDVPVENTPLLTASVTLPPARYESVEQRRDFFRRFLERLNGHASIASASIVSHLPVVGGARDQRLLAVPTARFGDESPVVQTVEVSPGYFETLGVNVLRGRPFAASDGEAAPVAIVNERFEELYFPAHGAIGATIETEMTGETDSATAMMVVGVAPMIRQSAGDPLPIVYVPNWATPPATVALIVRPERSQPHSLIATVRQELRGIDPAIPIDRPASLEQAIHDHGWNGRVSAQMARTLTGIATLLSLIGLYAVTASAVATRAPEFGLRLALGESRRGVMWIVMRRGLLQLAAGLACGLLLAVAFQRLLGDPDRVGEASFTMLPVVVLMSLASLAACAGPALRAASLDPARTLGGRG